MRAHVEALAPYTTGVAAVDFRLVVEDPMLGKIVTGRIHLLYSQLGPGAAPPRSSRAPLNRLKQYDLGG